MDSGEESALAREVAGAIAWWREAGVDLCFDDEPARWISPAQPTALEAERLRAELREAVPIREDAGSRLEVARAPGRRAPAESVPVVFDKLRRDAIDLAGFPDEPGDFAPWWLGEPTLDDGRSGGRVAPRGPHHAALMVLVPEPEQDDDDRLLSGPQGRLLTAMLAALGIAEEAVHVASALPRHMPMPDWPDLAARGFGEMLARHVALVAPTRLVAFGEGVLSLLGNSLTNNAAGAGTFARQGLQVPVFRARSLDALLARPAWKAELWDRMLDWMPPASGAADEGAEV